MVQEAVDSIEGREVIKRVWKEVPALRNGIYEMITHHK
jgi:hypothetical protein